MLTRTLWACALHWWRVERNHNENPVQGVFLAGTNIEI